MNVSAAPKTFNPAGLIAFRRCFAAVWLIYDVLDLSQSQLLNVFWFANVPISALLVRVLQGLLISCELLILCGIRPRTALFLACIFRIGMTSIYTLNDFVYFSVIALILSQVEDGEASPAWPRDLLVLQTAWIYLASAILKLNPGFLSGGDLFVRQNYLAEVLYTHYPAFYYSWINDLGHNALMAWMGVSFEMLMGILLFGWWYWAAYRRWLRWPVVLLALAVHGYAAMGLDVFFFGMSLFLQVYFVTNEITLSH